MVEEIRERIEILQRRLDDLRSRNPDSMALIAIAAVEHELTRVAQQLPPEWSFSGGAPADSRWWP